MPPPPTRVRNAVAALGLSALAAVVTSASLFGLQGWLYQSAKKSNAKLKHPKSLDTVHSNVSSTTHTYLIQSVVLAIALLLVARGVWRGRFWARWTVIGLWVLATLTGTFAGFSYLLGIASSEPVAFKIPSFVSAVSLLAAVVFVSLRPSAEYFALSKPPRPDGAAPARRSGLFGPRPARPGFNPPTATTARNSAGDAVERSRAKQRATTESVAKGAELARARAKASKSRRSGV